jgi:hypothetical protein
MTTKSSFPETAEDQEAAVTTTTGMHRDQGVRESLVANSHNYREIEKSDGNQSNFVLVILIALFASDETSATIPISRAKQRIITERNNHCQNI